MQDFFDDFGKNPFDFSKLQGDETTLKKGLAMAAEKLLPKLKLANNIVGRMAVSAYVKNMFNNAAADLKKGKFDAQLEKTSNDLKAVTREEIRAQILQKLNIASDAAAARDHAEKLQNSIKDLSEAEYVAFSKATYSVLPDLLKKAYDIILLDQSSIEDHARRFYRMSIDEKAQYELDMAAKVPVDALTDLVHDMLQKADKDKVQIITKHILATVSPGDAADIANNGIAFAEDLLKSVKEKNVLDAPNRKKADNFGKGLKNLFNAIEAGLVKAELLDPAAVESLLKSSFQKKAGPANDNGNSAGLDKKGPKFG